MNQTIILSPELGALKHARVNLFYDVRSKATRQEDFETTKNLCEEYLDAFYAFKSVANSNDRDEKRDGENKIDSKRIKIFYRVCTECRKRYKRTLDRCSNCGRRQ